jgi:hypothetical protein
MTVAAAPVGRRFKTLPGFTPRLVYSARTQENR